MYFVDRFYQLEERRISKMIGTEGGSRTRMSLRTTDFKSGLGGAYLILLHATKPYLPTFQPSKQATSGLVQAHNPLIFPSSWQVKRARSGTLEFGVTVQRTETLRPQRVSKKESSKETEGCLNGVCPRPVNSIR